MASTPARVVFARGSRDVVGVAGPDAATFLQGQLSQDVVGLEVGGTAWSFVLQPTGKVDAWCRVHRRADDAFELDVDAGWGERLLARIERFKLRTKCETTLEAAVPAVFVRGPAGSGPLGGGRPARWPGIDGSDLLRAGDPPDELTATAEDVGPEGLAALRIAAGVPAMGAELTDTTIPAEAGPWIIDASVSFTKGCYTGQELVARIDSRGGNVPRRLRGFRVAGPAPAAGEALVLDGDEVGVVTSAIGASADATGLAYLKRSVEVPATVAIGGRPAEVFALPEA